MQTIYHFFIFKTATKSICIRKYLIIIDNCLNEQGISFFHTDRNRVPHLNSIYFSKLAQKAGILILFQILLQNCSFNTVLLILVFSYEFYDARNSCPQYLQPDACRAANDKYCQDFWIRVF